MKGRDFMIVVKRKQVLIVGLAALVAVAGYLNANFGESAPTSSETLGEVKLVGNEDAADFFSEARLEREIGRAESVASLGAIAQNADTGEAARAAAEAEMVEIARLSETEKTIETMLLAQGFSDAVIYISGDSVTAIVKSEALSEAAVAKITDIITTQTGIPAANIKIIEAA